NEAAMNFDEIRRQNPINQRTTASFLMSAKAHYELKDYAESAGIVGEFMKQFPFSTYIPDAHYTLSLDLMMQRKYESAGENVLIVLRKSDDKVLNYRARNLFLSLGADRLSVSSLTKLYADTKSRDIRDLIAYTLAHRYAVQGETDHAKTMYGTISSGSLK